MLSLEERIIFLVAGIVSILLTVRVVGRIVKTVRSGRGAVRTDNLIGRILKTLIDVGLQKPLFKARPVVSTFHAFIFFGFSFYLLVNINEILEGYITGWHTIGAGVIANVFNLLADLLSILVMVGVVYFLVRRFIGKPKVFTFNSGVMLHPKVLAGGINVDSLLVGIFVFFHVGSRWMLTVFHLAEQGQGDIFLPTASLLAVAFQGMSPGGLELAQHASWWVSMGLVVVYTPYIPVSKAAHLAVAPINLALGRLTPRGAMDDLSDAANPGASELSDLPWPLVLDAFACIQCNRCQEVCPAHNSGTPLSPAALEINKRYHIKSLGGKAAENGQPGLLEYAISEDAVWSCTSCYACVRVCPVGNEPMMDIMELRRKLVFDANMPDELAEVLRNLDEQGNSFGESNRRRSRWTREMEEIEVKDATETRVKYLWFVGDYASFNPSCQDVSRKVARVLTAAGVDFGILHRGENSAGNDIRRVGEEGLFEALAEKNIEALEQCDFEEIFTTDPHTFNALKNEYPKLGGDYKVQHYATLLLELIESGQIKLPNQLSGKATYHDPCYLGRYNGVFDAPREIMRACGLDLVEMPRNRENSFCCGAGGGRIWMKDHEDMTQRPSENRIEEAIALEGVRYFTVACPKDMTMYSDAVKTSGNEGNLEVRDIIDYVMEAMQWSEAQPGALPDTQPDPRPSEQVV